MKRACEFVPAEQCHRPQDARDAHEVVITVGEPIL